MCIPKIRTQSLTEIGARHIGQNSNAVGAIGRRYSLGYFGDSRSDHC